MARSSTASSTGTRGNIRRSIATVVTVAAGRRRRAPPGRSIPQVAAPPPTSSGTSRCAATSLPVSSSARALGVSEVGCADHRAPASRRRSRSKCRARPCTRMTSRMRLGDGLAWWWWCRGAPCTCFDQLLVEQQGRLLDRHRSTSRATSGRSGSQIIYLRARKSLTPPRSCRTVPPSQATPWPALLCLGLLCCALRPRIERAVGLVRSFVVPSWRLHAPCSHPHGRPTHLS